MSAEYPREGCFDSWELGVGDSERVAATARTLPVRVWAAPMFSTITGTHDAEHSGEGLLMGSQEAKARLRKTFLVGREAIAPATRAA